PPAPVTTPVGDNWNMGGYATWFAQNNNAGACGQVHGDDAMIAAIDHHRYGDAGVKSPLCGRRVKIVDTDNGHSVTVTIADDCPTCSNKNSIDLSQGAFQQLAKLDIGQLPIKWMFVD
ncbi:barwin-like endoglucanase, partial [Cantharellus anzutake]|uniref:barwin-like endoglucanase n=1 Tax=Cantharellus anzutake TaxID=1750568 RepID=UPI001905D904